MLSFIIEDEFERVGNNRGPTEPPLLLLKLFTPGAKVCAHVFLLFDDHKNDISRHIED